MRRIFAVSAFVCLGIVAWAIFFPAFAGQRPMGPRMACLSNVKLQDFGLIMYAVDQDDRFPPRDGWADGIAPYIKNKEIQSCPSVPKGTFGYAFNGRLSEAKEPSRPDSVPMVYDSVNPIRNASDLVASLPKPGRHHEVNIVAYADGHAKLVMPK